MIRRLAVLAAALALPLFVGCAAPTDTEEVATGNEQALSGANGTTYVLTSFDGTSQFMGFNNQGKTINAAYNATTAFKAAALDKFLPQDPCRQFASDYNTAIVSVNDTGGFNTALTSLAGSSCHAKVMLDKNNVIKTFQPAP